MNPSLGQASVTSSYLFAAGLTLLSGLLFVSSHGIIRHIGGVGGTLHPFEIAFFSNLFSALFYLPMFFRRGAHVLKTEKLPLHIVRSLFNVTAITAWYTALTLTPLADVIALGLAAPLFVTLGAFFFLGEIFRTRRWIAVLVGIAGALTIIRPGFENVSTGFLFAILSTVFAAGTKIFAKQLVKTDSAFTCSAYVAILQTPITFFLALFVWQFPTIEQLVWMAAVGILVAMAHLSMVQAYKYVEVSSMEPFVFVRLVWAAGIGYLAFQEFPGPWTWAGAAIIVAASSYIARREAKAHASTISSRNPAARD